MLEYTWFEKKAGKNQWNCAHKQRENITPADIVLTVHWRANTEPLSSWSYAEEAIDPPVNLFSCISTAANPQRKATSPHPGHCFPPLI